MGAKHYTQLSIMMFLQFFIWGAWFVTLGTYLGSLDFSGSQIGYTYLMNNIAAILSPFFIGMIADRFFASEKVMGVLHLLGGVVLYFVSDITTAGSLIFGLLIYNICYMPTIALVNSVSFNLMDAPDAQFPKVRVWGTIGWIVAGNIISFVLAGYYDNVEATNIPMKMAAIASIIMGAYSFTLPHTPPKNIGKDISVGEILGFKALALLKNKSFAIFVISSLLISIPLAFYYNFTNLFLNDLGMEGVAGKMSWGQMSEIVFMILMPFFFKRFGVKWMLLVGMLAWVIRYAFFASGDVNDWVSLLYLGILLHGICYDFFFVTGQIYIDKKAGAEIRASAQGFIALVTYGIGIGLGSVVAGNIVDLFTTDGVRDWATIWWIPSVFALLITLIFSVTFNEKDNDK